MAPWLVAGKMVQISGRVPTPRFFGLKWYPMTLRPALPYAFGMALWYYAVTVIDAKTKTVEGKKIMQNVFIF